jgi:sugar-specific transcriptional regulator TrmB
MAAELYGLSLRSGSSPIALLAKDLGVSRPSVYALIKELESCGLVRTGGNYARKFAVESPSVVLGKLREYQEQTHILEDSIVSIMPDLLANYRQGASLTKIKILEGREQYLKIFNQSVEESKDEIKFFGSIEDFVGFVSWKIENAWIKKRIKNKIPIKALLLPSDASQTLKEGDDQEMRETRILKGAVPFKTSFMLFAGKLIFWQPVAPLAVLIEDEYITDMMRSIFEIVWDVSKPD